MKEFVKRRKDGRRETEEKDSVLFREREGRK
jgi:hypothetical protein